MIDKEHKWNTRWFQMVDLVSSWSYDPSTKVGAVIIPKNSDLPITGWNGFPRGVKDFPERYQDRETKYKLVSHAEANAILNAARHGVNLQGATIYISHPPCNECAKLIIQSGIKRVIYRPLSEDFKRWKESVQWSQLMFNESEVSYYEYEEEK